MNAERIDTLRSFETPEGVHLDLEVAGPSSRAIAWGVDALIRVLLVMAFSMMGAVMGRVGVGFWLLTLFVLLWLYHVLFETLAGGATPGKRALGLRVVHADGTPIGWSASVTRNFLRFVDGFPPASLVLLPPELAGLPLPSYFVGLVAMLLTERSQRTGDLVAGTLVVYARSVEPSKPTRLDLEPLAPPFPLRAEERRALHEFAERRGTWTRERQIEMTDLLEPVTGATGKEGRKRVLRMIVWLQEQR